MNWIDSDRRTRYINVGRYLYRLFMFFSSAALGSIDAALFGRSRARSLLLEFRKSHGWG